MQAKWHTQISLPAAKCATPSLSDGAIRSAPQTTDPFCLCRSTYKQSLSIFILIKFFLGLKLGALNEKWQQNSKVEEGWRDRY